MKVAELTNGFGIENLMLQAREVPRPGPHEVLVRMLAASLNYRDLLMITGKYNPRQPLPLIPCSDGVGVVVERGEQVTEYNLGDRVSPLFAQKWLSGPPTRERLRATLGGPIDGVLAEYRVFPESALVSVPDYLTDEEAATLPCAALTAWSALSTLGMLRAGETVLVQGTGGVALFALQLARLMGAKVVALSSSPEKLARLSVLGAEWVLSYKDDPLWGKKVQQLTGGVDHVIDVGGAGTLEQSLLAVRPGGTISIIGMLGGASLPFNVLPLLMNQIRLQGVMVGHKEGFLAMNRALETTNLHPVLDATFPLTDVRAAFKRLASGNHFGKITICISD